jgi:uncharacterized protein
MMPLDISEEYLGGVLALNNAHATELSPLTMDELRAILANAFYARRVGETEGFLIALDETHPTYASPNYLWFSARHPRFVYVDRVVVAEGARAKGHARRLYADLIAHARAVGHELIACEVNADPPNPASDAFHAALGFKPVGLAAIHGGSKTVRYLILRLKNHEAPL